MVDFVHWLTDHFDHVDDEPWCYECDEPMPSCVCDEPVDPDDLPPEAFMEFEETEATDG